MESEIQSLKQTYITLDELEQIIQPKEYMEFVEKINELKEHEVIKQIGSKKNTNVKIPSLVLKK